MQNSFKSSKNDKQPIVSFIITYYDLPVDLLCRCIESILSLSLRADEREIILVDDGSQKSPLAGLEQYIDDIIYIRQANGGLSKARNTGIQISTGTYLQFIDADDSLIRKGYEHCLDLVRYKQPDIVFFQLSDKVEEQSSVFEDSDQMSGPTFMRTNNLRGSACGYLFRRKTLSELRFTPGIYHEDEEFTPLLFLRADVIISTNATAYYYRTRENSIMTSKNVRHIIKRLNDAKEIILRLNVMADSMPTESSKALIRRVHQLTMDYIYNVIRLTHSHHYLDRQLAVLSKAGLYPLPKRDYTKKYRWLRRLMNSDMGLSMLMRAIPLMKKK